MGGLWLMKSVLRYEPAVKHAGAGLSVLTVIS